MPESPSSDQSSTAALVLATTPGAELTCGDGTLLRRLTDQLATLPVRAVHVVARAPAGGDSWSPSLADDLRSVADTAKTASGPVLIVAGDLVAHTGALAVLLRHPARSTAALVALDPTAPGPLRPAVRVEGGHVVSAGSSFHRVEGGNGTFRGAIQVGVADLGGLAAVATELAEFVETGRLGPVGGSEVGDLLLVGLVRSGTRVRAAAVGELHADRVVNQGSADLALQRLAEVDERAARLAAAVKTDDGVFATYGVSTWSRHLVKLAALIGLTPNAVTGFSVGLAFLAAVWFSAGSRGAQIAGALLLLGSFVLDCVDGQLARYTMSFSPLGAWLDATFDRVKEYVVYVGLAVGYAGASMDSSRGGVWLLAVAAFILQMLRHMIDFSYGGAVADAGSWARPPTSILVPEDIPARSGRDGNAIVRLSGRLERDGLTRRLKKVIVLPIGERMLLIAVTAAFFNAYVTFAALLVWGGAAALYSLTGRIARSLA
ncbi:CDP-alcohol phosphatidyltransferase [Sinosporangium album]|uniref:CDP-alcohol phosphatidyltransferase n=1 Tax=Sinosporangium album TaxID=504805 RepID=A0A1G7W199_9ACTN|nr:CDP-alcohol phosphatidyltransferase family protein [Sinosporangium album]SDG65746.1 CDP-alcohol phosphatidyltransferase [Sinosporangium album]